MTFEELGVILRTEREKKNINITDVANQLKINPRHLRAMEEGDISALPHPAYVRGFIRSYANLLGLGQEEVQEILNGIPNLNSGKSKIYVPEKSALEEKEGRTSHSGLKFLVFLCIAGVALYFLWDAGYLDFIRKWQGNSEQQSSELQSADSYIAAKDAEKARKEAEPLLGPQPAQESGAERSLPLPGNEPLAASTATEPKVNEQATTPVVEESAPPRPAEMPSKSQETALVDGNSEGASPGQHKLIIIAVEECWIHSNADKTDTRQFSLRKGDTFALTFADSLELKLGNAGGVRLRYDGNDLPPPGSSGQVRTITFPLKSNS